MARMILDLARPRVASLSTVLFTESLREVPRQSVKVWAVSMGPLKVMP